MDDRVGNFGRGRVGPGKIAVGGARGSKISRAMRHVDQVLGMQRSAERGQAGPRHSDAFDRFRRCLRLASSVSSGLGQGMVWVAAGYQLDRHVGDDVPRAAAVPGGQRRPLIAVDAAYRFEKPELHLQNALFCLVAALRRPHRLDAGHRRHAGVVFARDAGIGRLRQPARRGRGQCDRVCRLLGVEMEQAGRGYRRREDRRLRAVEAALAEPGHRVDNAARGLVTDDDRRQHLLAGAAVVLSGGQRGRNQRRATMHDRAQIAVIGGGGVAHHRIDLGGIDHRQFGAGLVEPDRGPGAAAQAHRHILDDAGGFECAAHRRAGQRRGDQHSRVVHRLRRQIGRRDAGQEICQLACRAHRIPLYRR